jgi:hypothetical protein
MARPVPRHVREAHDRARRDIGNQLRNAIDESRAARSAAGRLYGPNGPRGGPPRPSMLRGGEPTETLSAAQSRAIEKAAGDMSDVVMRVLTQAGLLGGRRGQAPPNQGADRGAMSPLGGAAT